MRRPSHQRSWKQQRPFRIFLSGRIVPEIGETSIREQFVHRYRIIYRIDPTHVLVAAVIHGRQEFEPYVARIQGTQKPDV
jgi:hypothetical protein